MQDDESTTFDLVSFNVLSLEMGDDDNYLNLDGTVKPIPVEKRREMIKIEARGRHYTAVKSISLV